VETSKADIRKQVLARRDALDAERRSALSRVITTRLLAHDSYRAAGCVAAYVSFGGELETGPLIADILTQGKTLALPRVDRESRGLKFYAVRDLERDLAAGVWGIRQPRPDICAELAPATLEFVLVPGVAFTRRCERLGYGGGYYDAFIRGMAHRPALVAGAFELQLLPELPTTERDQAVDIVVTEAAMYPRPRK
jgi:5-formyltetrahydrofolate cyclo-ligase